jgi:flagellar protein FliT
MAQTIMSTNNTDTITTYEAILIITNKMLAVAEDNEWDKLIVLEKECKKLTSKLVNNKSEQRLSDELLQKKVKIIHLILANDAKIRSITEPWMAQLQNMLNTAGQKRNLQQAYNKI